MCRTRPKFQTACSDETGGDSGLLVGVGGPSQLRSSSFCKNIVIAWFRHPSRYLALSNPFFQLI